MVGIASKAGLALELGQGLLVGATTGHEVPEGLHPECLVGGHGRVLVVAVVVDDVFGCREQARKLDQGRDGHALMGCEKRTAFLLRETQRALAGLVVDVQEVVDLPERARRLAGAGGAAALGPPHEDATPAIRGGIAERAEERFVSLGVKGAGAKAERRLQGEATGRVEPALVVFEGGTFAALAAARPKASREKRHAFEIHSDEGFGVHLAPKPA